MHDRLITPSFEPLEARELLSAGKPVAIPPAPKVKAPVLLAKAGPDVSLRDYDGDGFRSLMLNGLGSQRKVNITSYTWKEGDTVLGVGAKLKVDLAVGQHTITLEIVGANGTTSTDTRVVTILPTMRRLGSATQVSVAGPATPVSESDGIVTFTFTRTGDLSKALSVQYSLAGTATPVEDYLPPQRSVTFRPGEAQATLEIQLVADDVDEEDETIELTLLTRPIYTILNGTAIATITDPAAPPPEPPV